MDLTVRDAGDLVIWLGAICGALVAIGLAINWAIIRPLRHFIAEEIKTVAKPLETPNGKTVAQYVEGSSLTLEAIEKELHATNTLVLQNQIEVLALGRRLDEHLMHHSHQGGTP